MGLRTASVRRPHVVMAPALTETTQSQGFKLAPPEHFQPVSPINSYKPKSYCLDTRGEFCVGSDELKPFTLDVKPSKSENGIKHVVLQTGKVSEGSLSEVYKASGKLKLNFRDIMNNTPTLMGDQNKMGLQKNGKEPVSYLQKDKTDVEQLLCNFNTDSTSGDCSTGDLTSPPNVDDIMQVITSMEGETDRLGAGSNDLNDVDFSMTGADIANNLLSFEKQLLNDVDMMNISIEDQQEHDNAESIKECRSKDMIAESQRRQARVQRRLDFLKRRVLKFQARLMGQHVSSEVSGVFEHVHQSLKKLKDSSVQDISRPLDASSGSVIQPLPVCESYEKFKPLSYGSTKTLARKLEMSTILQANSAARQRHVPKYFGSGSIEPNTFRTSVTGMIAIPPWPTEYKYELQKVSGLLRTELGVVQAEVDSEATDSSSGGESCDEFQNYSNQHQQYLSIQKRALWKYSTERAAIAARWTWLQVQISDLEYRIRQHSELHRQIRSGKGQVVLGGANPSSSVPTSPTTVNGYRGQLPGNSPSSPKVQGGSSSTSDVHPEYQCARTRPLISFKKRKLLQIKGLHIISKKAARPSTTRCGCVPPAAPCAVCTGRTDPTYPRDPPETMSKFERVALLDPSFHPVFSMIEDVSESIHLEAIMKMPEWQQRSARMKSIKGYCKSERLDKSTLEHRSKKLEHRKKYGRHLKPSTMSALSAKIKKIRGRKAKHALNRLNRKRVSGDVPSPQTRALSTDGLDEEVESISNNSNNVSRSAGGSPSLSPLLHMQSISGYSKKNRINSYDIDNIVIPYSVAASTRVEKLQYKEILTPKWRIADPDYIPQFEIKNNGSVRSTSQDSEPEDLNEDAVSIRHDKCEHDERKKFLSYLKLPVGYGRTRSHKRTDSRAESSGANTPDRMSPHPIDNPENTSPLGSPPATPLSLHIDEQGSLPSISVMRRRTMSQSRFVKDKEVNREDNRCASPETVEVPPFDRRNFPLDDGTYDKMLEHMPEDHQFLTNSRAQDMLEYSSTGYLDTKIGSPGSESTESALAEEDPNDPEWIDVERAARERHKR